jgi:hypothetical protein
MSLVALLIQAEAEEIRAAIPIDFLSWHSACGVFASPGIIVPALE